MEEKILLIEISAMRDTYDKTKSLDKNLRTIFRQLRDRGTSMGWAHLDEDLFKVGVGVCLIEATEEDRIWLKAQMKTLAIISHAFQGAALGIPLSAEGLAQADEDGEAVPKRDYALMALWHDSKKATT